VSCLPSAAPSRVAIGQPTLLQSQPTSGGLRAPLPRPESVALALLRGTQAAPSIPSPLSIRPVTTLAHLSRISAALGEPTQLRSSWLFLPLPLFLSKFAQKSSTNSSSACFLSTYLQPKLLCLLTDLDTLPRPLCQWMGQVKAPKEPIREKTPIALGQNLATVPFGVAGSDGWLIA